MKKRILIWTIIILSALVILIIIPEVVSADETKISSNNKDENPPPQAPEKENPLPAFPLATIPIVPDTGKQEEEEELKNIDNHGRKGTIISDGKDKSYF